MKLLDSGDCFHYAIFEKCEGHYLIKNRGEDEVSYDWRKKRWSCTCADATMQISLQKECNCKHILRVRLLLKR